MSGNSTLIQHLQIELVHLDDWRIISQELKNSGKSLIRVDHNLVDLVWSQNGQPEEPCSELIALGEEFSGKLKSLQIYSSFIRADHAENSGKLKFKDEKYSC